MFRKIQDRHINELKSQRKAALDSFNEVRLIKNEILAEYFFAKFKEGKDVPFEVLKDIPVGEMLLLPVVYGGAIITTREKTLSENKLIYTTKWTAGSTLTLHYHSDCNETIEVIEGTIKIYFQGTENILKVGDKVEVSSGVLHQVTALSKAKLQIIFRKTR